MTERKPAKTRRRAQSLPPAAEVIPIRPAVTLGGSRAAAACGIDPYCSRPMLWLELTGRYERPESEAMRWGTLLEPVVFAELAERGYAVERGSDLELRDPARPWRLGHFDGYVEQDDAPGILEIKTVGRERHDGDGPPLAWVAQVQHYLSLTELDFGLLAVLVGGQRLEVHTVERDEAAIALLLKLEEEFMGYVWRDTPPPPDGSESSREALGLLYPEARPGASVMLAGESWGWLRELRERREQRDAVDAQIRELENRLKGLMGDAELAVSPFDTPALRWSNVAQTRLDITKLKAERPEIYDAYSVPSTTRRFSLA